MGTLGGKGLMKAKQCYLNKPMKDKELPALGKAVFEFLLLDTCTCYLCHDIELNI